MKIPKKHKEKCPMCAGCGEIVIPDQVGYLFKKQREAKGLTMQQVFEETGISVSQMSNFENGRYNFSQQRIRDLLEYLGKK